ncbi:16032_t:CDS:2, partial [Racocetra persica]
YATANGLLKKAIQLGLDVGSSAIQDSDESDGFDSFDDNDELDSQDIENINLSLIQNPIIYTKKGALCKTRFKESYEVKQKNAERQKTKR